MNYQRRQEIISHTGQQKYVKSTKTKNNLFQSFYIGKAYVAVVDSDSDSFNKIQVPIPIRPILATRIEVDLDPK